MQQALGALFLGIAAVVTYALLRGERARGAWLATDAVVLGVRPVPEAYSDLRHVTARLALPDGTSVEGESQDAHEAHRWRPGEQRRAWYDPADPSRFTLSQPGFGRGSGKGVWFVAVGALCAAGFFLLLIGGVL